MPGYIVSHFSMIWRCFDIEFEHVSVSKQNKCTPILGPAHGSDVNVKDGVYLMTEYVAKFAQYLDPNLGDNVPA
ncbi:hypothetical protein AN958_11838 [Leucoagaricus sp. SymC.cos]|nr:hypothetical protein AN958_11838 [Leucoagaricus sp. SymC.cos]